MGIFSNSFLRIVFIVFFLFQADVFGQFLACPSNKYYVQEGTELYEVDALTNVANLSTIVLPFGAGGFAFGAVNGIQPSPALFTIVNQFVHYYNGVTWVNTGHSGGDVNALNLCTAGGFLYSLNIVDGRVYRYDGLANATFAMNVPLLSGPADIVGDNEGNIYFLKTKSAPFQLIKYAPNGNILCTYPVRGMDNLSFGGGGAVVGNKFIVERGDGAFLAAEFNNNALNFVPLTAPIGKGVHDFASCEIQNPIVSNMGNVDLSCLNNTVQLTVSDFSYTTSAFQWSGPGIVGASNVQTITVNAPGAYSVVVTPITGCPIIKTITVGGATSFTAVASVVQNNKCALNNGEVTVTVNGGEAPFSYSWDNGATSQNVSDLAAGTYSVLVTDNKGCEAKDTVIVQQDVNNIVGNLVVTPINCNGDANGEILANITSGQAPYSYNWSNGATNDLNTGLAAGNYSLIVTDNEGCTETFNQTLSNPTSLSAALVINNPILCNGDNSGVVEVIGNGGTLPYTYNWNTTESTSVISNLIANTYKVEIVDANGCTYVDSIALAEPAKIVLSLQARTDLLCNGGNNAALTIDAVGGVPNYTYLWNDANAQTNALATGLIAGNYTVSVADANGCLVDSMFAVTEPPALQVVINTQSNVSCNGFNNGEVSVNVIGGTPNYTYLWNDVEANTTPNLAGVRAGTYEVIITDLNGCSVDFEVQISEPTVLNLALQLVESPLCFGNANGSIEIDVTGGTPNYAFIWNDANQQTVQNPTGLVAGNYTVIVTDANNCSNQLIVAVNEPVALSCVIDEVNAIMCNGDASGEIAAVVTGGTPNYSYLWNNGQATANLVGLSSGSYSVEILDDNNCVSRCQYDLIEPAKLVIELNNKKDVTCFGFNDGEIEVNVAGGVLNYSYLWDDGNVQNTPNAVNLIAGVYTVVVTDNNGCVVTLTETIQQPPLLDGDISVVKPVSCFGSADGSLKVETQGGVQPYQYIWNNGNLTDIINPVGAGNYSVQIKDANGCVSVVPGFTFTQPEELRVVAFASPFIVCAGYETTLKGSALGGVEPYTYLWNNQWIGEQVTVKPNATSNFEVKATDANGCVATSNVLITLAPSPVADFVMSDSVVATDNGMVVFDDLSTGMVGWTWVIDGNIFSNESSIAYEFLDTGIFCVDLIVISETGCLDTTSQCIKVLPGYNCYIPNAFSPNGDKLNPVFYPIVQGVKKYHFQVFNRWGEKIFETNDPLQGWDGINSKTGKHLPQGVYVYKLDIVDFSDLRHKYLGDINLIY